MPGLTPSDKAEPLTGPATVARVSFAGLREFKLNAQESIEPGTQDYRQAARLPQEWKTPGFYCLYAGLHQQVTDTTNSATSKGDPWQTARPR